jgi:hypothetical protein
MGDCLLPSSHDLLQNLAIGAIAIAPFSMYLLCERFLMQLFCNLGHN